MSIYTLHPQQPANYRTSVKALIQKNGKILLAREAGGGWEFPGGGLDHGELPQQGLEREFQEELGVRPSRISGAPSAYWTMSKTLDGDSTPTWFAFVLYEVDIDNNAKIVFGEEAIEIGYFSLEEIKEMNIQPNTSPYFEKNIKS